MARFAGRRQLRSHISAPKDPSLRLLTSPVSLNSALWEFASASPIVRVAAGVCGRGLKFYHTKLSFKWPKGGQVFDWQHDMNAWPHTNYSPVRISLYLEDCGPEQGPLQTVKGCHEEPLRSMDDDGNWVLRIPEEKMAENWRERTVLMTGAGSFLVLLKCRVIHGSARNASARMRLLLLNVYSLADSLAYVTNPIPSEYERAIVAGSPARRFCHHPLGCEMPPDWSKGYVGPWQHQQQSGGAIAR